MVNTPAEMKARSILQYRRAKNAMFSSTALASSGGGASNILPSTQLNLWISFDIDNVDPDERDDEDACALILATQEWFNIVGVDASAPDSHIAQWNSQIDAYAADMPKLLTHSPFPSRYKSPVALKALGVQGAIVDAPARGYWIVGDGAGYNAPHAAAQALITAAQTYGNPGGKDFQKLWVFVQGGFTTLAQAAHEAIELGQLPDFFKRIRVVGQPNYNTWWAPNCWNYLVSNSWPSAGTPGLFGDLWLLAGYYQFHGFNRNNGGSDTTFWNTVVTRGAMGAFLDAERAGSAFPQTYFRAGDGGAFFWLISARIANNFDPTNVDNWCGKFRSYVGELWAAQTFGYDVGTGTPNPEHTWYNPHAWAPELTVNSSAEGQNAVDLTQWYEVAGEAMERYGVSVATSTLHLSMGSRSTVFNLTGDTTVDEDVNASYSLAWLGPAITTPVTVTFSETNPSNMETALSASLAAISQTGVTASGNSLIITSAASSPIAFTRPPDDTLNGARSYGIQIASVSGGGFVPIGVTTAINDVSAGFVNPEAEAFVARMTVEPSSGRKTAIDNFFTAVKAIGLAKFDGLWLLAAHDQQAANLNLKSTSFTIVPTGGTFTVDRGYTTDGVDDFLDTGFDPSTAPTPAFTQNSAHISFYNRLDASISHGTPWVGMNDDGSAPNFQIAGKTSTGNFSLRANDATTFNVGSQTINVGLFAGNRSASNNKKGFRDGTQVGTTQTTASTGVPAAPLWIGRINATYSNREFSFASVGGSLSDAEHASLSSAVNAYLTSVGAL